jgi:hypothetical protein
MGLLAPWGEKPPPVLDGLLPTHGLDELRAPTFQSAERPAVLRRAFFA